MGRLSSDQNLGPRQNQSKRSQPGPDFDRITRVRTTPFAAAWRLNHAFTKFLTYNFKEISW